MADGQEQAAEGVVEQAAHWHVHLHSGEATAEDVAEFERWRQHPQHDSAYQKLDGIWNSFEQLVPQPAARTLESAFRAISEQSRKLKSRTGQVLTLLLAVVAACLLAETDSGQYWLSDYRTPAGDFQQVRLADGSRVTLNTYTALDVKFTQEERRIVLHQGEILVQVAKDDSGRPFIVETSQGTARALGTRYAVRRMESVTEVAVVESVVEACNRRGIFSSGRSQCLTLRAGDKTWLTSENVSPLQHVDVDSIGGWVNGSLVLDDVPVSEVLVELERYRHGRIYFDARDISSLRVSGVLPLDDTDRALEILTGLLPIRVQHYPLLVVVRPR